MIANPISSSYFPLRINFDSFDFSHNQLICRIIAFARNLFSTILDCVRSITSSNKSELINVRQTIFSKKQTGNLSHAIDKIEDNHHHERNSQIDNVLASCEQGQVEDVKLYLEKGGDPNAKNEKGHTILMTASSKGYKEIVNLSLDYGADPNSLDIVDRSALLMASYSGNEEIVKLLIERGANLNKQDANGASALHCASHEGHNKIVEILLINNADLQRKDRRINTPLHYAAIHGHQKIVELLIKYGADINAVSKAGLTPAIGAYIHNHKNLANFLGLSSTFHQDWLFHKMINHRFGLGIEIHEQNSTISLDLFSASITYPILLDSIKRLRQWEQEGPSDWEYEDTQSVLKVIKDAHSFLPNDHTLEGKIDLACEHYQKKETLVLSFASNQKHEQVIIFTSDYLIRGDRAPKIFKPGLTINRINNKENVPQVIAQILANNEKPLENGYNFFFKEIEKELTLSSPYICPHARQHSGVCTWTSSAKLAFRGALIAQLLKKGYSLQEADVYSKKMYKKWVLDDRLTAIQDYINLVDESDIKTYVLGCVYKHLTIKKTQNSTEDSIIALIEKQAPQAFLLASDIEINYAANGKRTCRLKV